MTISVEPLNETCDSITQAKIIKRWKKETETIRKGDVMHNSVAIKQ